jgi:hypothetical protein
MQLTADVRTGFGLTRTRRIPFRFGRRARQVWGCRVGVAVGIALVGCADESSMAMHRRTRDAAVEVDDPFKERGFTNPDLAPSTDGGSLSPDAFFINDPPPPYCGEDGKMRAAQPVSGTLECPDDKNREGCPCSTPGQQALCWPGQRINRSHGVCKDGMTRCIKGTEFGNRWGSCDGYVLPVEGKTEGADACLCFSNGTWKLDNLVPCIAQDAMKRYFVYSSRPSKDTGYVCDGLAMTPPPVPADDWTASSLKVDCGGRFELCYTIKSGDVTKPSADDCVLMRSCVNVWYARAGSDQKLPNLKGWAAADQACAQKFVERGGYGEMSVLGLSSECEAVDDGQGAPYVFKRASYCPPSCAETPDRAECKSCSASGAGEF